MLTSVTSRRFRLPGERPLHLLLLGLAVSTCGDWLYNVALLALSSMPAPARRRGWR